MPLSARLVLMAVLFGASGWYCQWLLLLSCRLSLNACCEGTLLSVWCLCWGLCCCSLPKASDRTMPDDGITSYHTVRVILTTIDMAPTVHSTFGCVGRACFSVQVCGRAVLLMCCLWSSSPQVGDDGRPCCTAYAFGNGFVGV